MLPVSGIFWNKSANCSFFHFRSNSAETLLKMSEKVFFLTINLSIVILIFDSSSTLVPSLFGVTTNIILHCSLLVTICLHLASRLELSIVW